MHDWYLKEWMKTLRVTQAELCRRTDYPKAKMSELTTGIQRYNKDIVNELALAMNLRPYELLMHPQDAMAMRRMRKDAARIAAVSLTDDEDQAVSF